MKSAYLSKMCLHVLELPFVKCNENYVFLFEGSIFFEKWYFSCFVLLFISWKRTEAAKRIVKNDVNNGKFDNMGNATKTVIHIPCTQG